MKREYRGKVEREGFSISVYGFYDESFGSWRFSWVAQTVDCFMGSGGYNNDDDSVAYPTKESAMESAISAIAGQDVQKKRDMMIDIILEI